MSSFLITGGDGQLGHCFRNVAVEFPNHHLIFANRQEVDLARPETLQDFFDTNPLRYLMAKKIIIILEIVSMVFP